MVKDVWIYFIEHAPLSKQKKRSLELSKHLKHFAHEYAEKKEQDRVMKITNNHLYQ